MIYISSGVEVNNSHDPTVLHIKLILCVVLIQRPSSRCIHHECIFTADSLWPQTHREPHQEQFISPFDFLCPSTPLPPRRTTCCGTAWGPRWLTGTAARRRWRLTPELWSCSRGSSGPATTWASAASTWGHTGQWPHRTEWTYWSCFQTFRHFPEIFLRWKLKSWKHSWRNVHKGQKQMNLEIVSRVQITGINTVITPCPTSIQLSA